MTFITARENVFATECLHQVPFRFRNGGWTENLKKLSGLSYRGTIVGPRGAGKSTLMRQLVDRLAALDRRASYYSFPRDGTEQTRMLGEAIEDSKDRKILLIDGIERLSFFQRRQLLRASKLAAGLVLAQHRRGRLPTWIYCQTSLSLMRDVLSDLGILNPEIIAAGDRAFAEAKGNIRDALRDLYDQFAAGKFLNGTGVATSSADS